MSIEKRIGGILTVGGAAILFNKLRAPKIEWEVSDSFQALGAVVIVCLGIIAFLTAPKK